MIRVRINARTKAASGKFTTIAKDPPTSISVVTSTVTSKRSRGLINGSATKVISALGGSAARSRDHRRAKSTLNSCGVEPAADPRHFRPYSEMSPGVDSLEFGARLEPPSPLELRPRAETTRGARFHSD